jgi:hypothetical protein
MVLTPTPIEDAQSFTSKEFRFGLLAHVLCHFAGRDNRRSFDYASRDRAAGGFAQDDTSILE